MAPSPVVARWELSRRLTARRKEQGVDVKTITAALGFSRNYWSAVENDRTLIAEDKLRLLFDLLDFDESDQTELLQLREDSRKRGWWDEYPSLSDEHKRFYGMEAGASQIHAYGGHLIPGFLQTDDYAKAVIASDPGLSLVEVERIVGVRHRRQQQLLDGHAPKLVVLLSEAALRQQVAGPAAQAAQLRSIEELLDSHRLDLVVRILPFDVNPGAIVNSPTLVFLVYDKPHLPTTVIQEGVQLFDDLDADDDDFRLLQFAWEDALTRALEESKSMALLRQAISDFDDSASR